MNTAEKIVNNQANIINGIVQHYRISAMAEKEKGVEFKGTPRKSYYKFLDGSTLAIDHTLGDYKIF